MDLRELHLSKLMDLKRHSESDLTRNINMEEKQTKDDFSHARRLNEQTRCSPRSFNYIQTSQYAQPNQQFQVQLRPLMQNSKTGAFANATAQSFIAWNNLQSKVKASNATLLNSTPNQVAPIVTGMIQNNPTTSKDWHQSVTQDLRNFLIQRIVQKIYPMIGISILQDETMINLVAYATKVEGNMYEAANSREEYFRVINVKIYKLHEELEEKRQKRKEMQRQQQVGPGFGPILSNNSSAATLRKSKDFSNEETKKVIQSGQRQLFQMREKIRKIETYVKEMEDSGISEDETGIPVIGKDYGKVKKIFGELSIKLEQAENKLNEMKKMLEERGIFILERDPCFINTKQTPSEVSKSIRDCDHIEGRRYNLRQEIVANRRNNRLRAANLNRGLAMDEDSQGASESDRTFDLSSLGEALPPISHHSKKAAGMKRRSLKMQDIIMNNMKENRTFRQAVAGMLSMYTTTAADQTTEWCNLMQ